MRRKVVLSVAALVAALFFGWFLFSTGAPNDVGAQGLVEYGLLFGSPNAFVVKAASFITSAPPESEVTNVWKPTKISDGCSNWETEKDFEDAKAIVSVLPGNDLLESLEASLQTFIFLEIPPDSIVTICDRMLHAPAVEDFTVYDLNNPPPSP